MKKKISSYLVVAATILSDICEAAKGKKKISQFCRGRSLIVPPSGGTETFFVFPVLSFMGHFFSKTVHFG